MSSVIQIETDLSPGQLNKFKSLFAKMQLRDGKAYFPTSEMHGVLLTHSKQNALNIIKAHLRFVQPYIWQENDDQYLKHIGIDILLEQLGEESPKKKTQYLAARAYISAWLANNPEVFKDAQLTGQELDRKKISAMQSVRNKATHCALSGKPFGQGVECHVHHIEGVSEQPDLATDPKNLIAICEDIHKAYHSWVNSQGGSVTRATLKQFAALHGYKRNW
ncbi:MAG: hypothetical protein J0L70_26655 [Leptolyngbya sp. UWPOB_LEPTO1]|uniref:HNH endonuclease n=1 Tax=Leptolyngbya sp. UWPOB_LEPTO1 TaxID=2815653 RepID=UPI001AC1E69B|nr:HNH endonuclease [Leptolyngbya sp. UWPOB_LEPTO1]MBN8564121.1 hypothetical protein [Leptolyngbya sp. UWPOB_LEPTO1]